jgi:hypothetical protein
MYFRHAGFDPVHLILGRHIDLMLDESEEIVTATDNLPIY